MKRILAFVLILITASIIYLIYNYSLFLKGANNTPVVSGKILEAEKYINSVPDSPSGYIVLSSALVETKQYTKAIDALEKALTLCFNNNERFAVYYNLAIVYTRTKDWKNALKYSQQAKEINSTEQIEGLVAMINYNLGNKETAKKIYIESLNKNPKDIINTYNLSIIYIKELKFKKAGKLLNNLIKHNPDAKNDSKIKSLNILIFLFK